MKDKIIKAVQAPFRFILFLIDRVLAAAGALIFAQFPSFIVQYQQRLGGHVDELNLIISKYREAAARNNRTLDEYISIHLNSTINDFVSSGKIMQDNISRYNDLHYTLQALLDSSGLMKLIIFIKTLQFDIYQKTLDNFTPGISFNSETLLYSLTGIIFIMGIYYLIKKSLQIFFKTVSGSLKK